MPNCPACPFPSAPEEPNCIQSFVGRRVVIRTIREVFEAPIFRSFERKEDLGKAEEVFFVCVLLLVLSFYFTVVLSTL